MVLSSKQTDQIGVHVQHVFAILRQQGTPSISPDILKQLIREVAIGVYLDNAWPEMTISMGFDGNPYPDSTTFTNRLVGSLMAQLTYYLEGFIHGGMLQPTHWMENDAALPQFSQHEQILDVKKFYQTNYPDVDYQPLSERLF